MGCGRGSVSVKVVGFFINYITVITCMSFFKECFSAITTQGSLKKRMRNEASFA